MPLRALFSLFSIILLVSNLPAQSFVLSGTVTDSESLNSLPFATLISTKYGGGTISNQDGYFKLRVEANDTVQVRYTGYKPFSYVVRDSVDTEVKFQMIFSENVLTEVNIVAADERAFNIIAKVKKQLLKSGYQRSKAFLEIFTEKDSIPTELLELYYNSSFRNGNVESLEYKSGRLAMAPVQGSFFKSYSTSRVIQSHNPLTSAGFPENVFTTKKNALSEAYSFKIINYGSGGETLIFETKDDYQNSHFSGSISLEANQHLSEIEFYVENPSQIPFVPLFEKDLLKPLELRIKWIYTCNEKGLAP
ncbi:MAG: carboxypeptidase-like regulatory domain-containing protein, partial [Bacteroidota bacterium]